jgi:hypothetical protein
MPAFFIEERIGSGSFLKKRTKKLLSAGPWAFRRQRPWPSVAKVFCCFFLKKQRFL